MYTLAQLRAGLREGISNPILFLREVNRIYFTRRYGPGYDHRGVDVFEEDWDTLVILDACRYDMFAELNWLDGRLERRRSRASHTKEFLQGNFHGRTLRDTVYTTASPQLQRRRDAINVEFHAVENVWNTDRWDDEEGTVRPEAMTDAAIEAHERFPDKRHLVHYMQPHYPFVGSSVDDETRGFHEGTDDGLDIWQERIRGNVDVTPADLWPAYRRNLELALDAVERLCGSVDGRIVVSSDHGNVVGERAFPIPIREWGHPSRLYLDVLVTVPWLVVEGSDRREIRAERGDSPGEQIEESVVTDRLRDLGYVG